MSQAGAQFETVLWALLAPSGCVRFNQDGPTGKRLFWVDKSPVLVLPEDVSTALDVGSFGGVGSFVGFNAPDMLLCEPAAALLASSGPGLGAVRHPVFLRTMSHVPTKLEAWMTNPTLVPLLVSACQAAVGGTVPRGALGDFVLVSPPAAPGERAFAGEGVQAIGRRQLARVRALTAQEQEHAVEGARTRVFVSADLVEWIDDWRPLGLFLRAVAGAR